ncbi:LytR/AlgR family response regulator transcription factor [Pedobacter duraquae]|uniref:LytTR family two component transcriptional regulator n=1 Tax=Pedobacter duraquae TaxID=425511 RepID=A0A4R6ID93_9SPHI|nr:LytTR family DNA-binding domain-containing protein [Pedobacter duraquae]TDO19972.1 LytTR family two component transcriptional regulator [Pedobacter duraquae]
MNMLKCVVVDDEFPAVKLLGDYIVKTPGLELSFKSTSAMEALEYIGQHQVDLLFLDIQMPELTGMELVKIIKHAPIHVIITTAYTEYAIEGYEHDVADYLLKPVTFERFLVSINKVRLRISASRVSLAPDRNPSPAYIFIKTEYRVQKVLLASIQYIEGLGDYITIHTPTGKILSLERMKNMEGMLPSSFLRIHKSYIVNIDQIDFIEKGRIIVNKEYLPVGESFKDKVRLHLGLKN